MEKNKFLTSSNLKLIAIIIMFVDHFGASGVYHVLSTQNYMFSISTYHILRYIGRIAFPIFAFLIAEGFFYTRNVNKYLLRLTIFAFISEIPFDLAFSNTIFDFGYQNVFFTLTLGLLSIIIFDKFKKKNSGLGFLFVLIIGVLASLLKTDYDIFGVLLIFAFYYFRGNFVKVSFSVIVFIIMLIDLYNIKSLYSVAEIFAIFSLVFIYFYNNKKGKNLKYLFYAFYPVHLLLLYFVRSILK